LQKQTRVQLYLPIADIPVNVFLILAMGAAVGFVSGMFGIGGGFLMTPLLIFVGIAPAVAVASVASHIAASSFSGAISLLAATLDRSDTRGGAVKRRHGRHRARGVDLHAVARARPARSPDCNVLRHPADYRRRADVLEGLRALLRARRGGVASPRRPGSHGWIHGLPLKMRFKRSKIYLSLFPSSSSA
jgi:hypothetical protein